MPRLSHSNIFPCACLQPCFSLPLIMRLHTDVYRYFIVDALFMAPHKKRTKFSTAAASGGLCGWGFWGFYVHVPLMVKGRKHFIMTITLIISMTNWKSLPFSLERGHWSERMSFEIYCTKDATLLYMYLSLCSCSLVVVVLSWLKGLYFGFLIASFTKCVLAFHQGCTTKIWTPIQHLESL